MVAKHLRVSKSCVWSLGLWAVGYGEAVAAKDKNGKWRRKRIETIMSRRSLKKMTNRVVFRINAINVRDRQLVKDILVTTWKPNMWIYRWNIWGFPLFPPQLYILPSRTDIWKKCKTRPWLVIWFLNMLSLCLCTLWFSFRSLDLKLNISWYKQSCHTFHMCVEFQYAVFECFYWD